MGGGQAGSRRPFQRVATGPNGACLGRLLSGAFTIFRLGQSEVLDAPSYTVDGAEGALVTS